MNYVFYNRIMNKYKKDQIVYFVRSNVEVKEAKIINCANGFCTIRFLDTFGGIRVRDSKLYATKEEAEQHVTNHSKAKRQNYKPYW